MEEAYSLFKSKGMAYEDFLGLKPEETPSLPTRWINIDVSQGQDVEKVQEMVTKAIEKYADEYAGQSDSSILNDGLFKHD